MLKNATLPLDRFLEYFNTTDTLAIEDAYEHVGWFRRACDVRAEAVRSFPFDLFEGSEVAFTENPFSADEGTFTEYPDEIDIFHLLDDMVLDLDMHGAFYARYETNQFGRNGRWRRLHPASIEPQYDNQRGLTSFKRQTSAGSTTIQVDDDTFLYLWMPPRKQEKGHGVGLAVAALMAATGMNNTERFQSAFFENGALNPTILSINGFEKFPEGEQERVKGLFQRIMGGLRNAFNIIPVGGDVTATNLMQPLREMGMQELTQSQRETIATTLGVPHSLLFSDAANYATASQDDLNFYDKAVVPLVKLLQQQLNQRLFKPRGYVLNFAKERLEVYQALEGQKADWLMALVDRGVITRKQAAQRMGFAFDDGSADDNAEPDTEAENERITPADTDESETGDEDAMRTFAPLVYRVTPPDYQLPPRDSMSADDLREASKELGISVDETLALYDEFKEGRHEPA